MLRMPVILLDPGHGKDTPGKCSPDASARLIHSPLYFREYAWARKCAQAACDLLQADGYTAFLLVKEEEDIPLATRVNRVEIYCRQYGKGNVLLISSHVNAASDDCKWHDASGWSCYTTKGVTESDKLAQALYDVALREFPAQGRKVRKYGSGEGNLDYEENYYILRNASCPAVLIEHFFQDCKADVAYLKSDLGLATCAQVIADGVARYIEKYR